MIALCRNVFQNGKRDGSALVELAILMPIVNVLLLGVLEVSQAMRVSEILTEASRNGCSTASYPCQTNADVIAEVQNALKNSRLDVQNATVTILINDVQGSIGSAKQNDKITVIVSMPWSSVNYSKTNYFFGNSTITECTTMLKAS